MQSNENKVKKQRLKEVKKWNNEEIQKILEYIMQTGNLEKPTAQLYYRKLVEQTGIDADWIMVRWKMRNLKIAFSKCNEWRKSTGAGLVDEEDNLLSVNAKILKMCPHYDRLQEIFGEKRSALEVIAYDSTNFNAMDESICEEFAMESNEPRLPQTSENIAMEPTEVNTELLIILDEPTTDSTPKNKAISSCARQTSTFAERLKRSAPKTSLQKLSDLHNERNVLNNKKIELDQKKFDREVKMDEKRLKLETTKLELEENKLKWDQEKFKSDQELRIMQLEKEERIAMFEIEMKYKHKQY